MTEAETVTCRWCGAVEPSVVLDLGRQPAADLFPRPADPLPDPVWPLQLVCCPACGLVQLGSDPGLVEEPLGVEPQALVEQAQDAVGRVVRDGLIGSATSIAEFDSPHGGSWRSILQAAGCADHTDTGETADVVVDVFGLMHDADQAAALTRRIERVAPGGTLLLQYHSLHTIVTQQQWNALRHGHMAYYSTRWLTSVLAGRGLTAHRARTFALYGGTVLLEARRDPQPVEDELAGLLAADDALGLTDPGGCASLATGAGESISELVGWLRGHRDAGRTVWGYGAASRAIPLLVAAGIDIELLPAVADGSPAKQGRTLPGSRIPVVSPAELASARPDVVLVFVPDLLDEVRRARPEVEAGGGRWAVSEPRPRLVAPLAP